MTGPGAGDSDKSHILVEEEAGDIVVDVYRIKRDCLLPTWNEYDSVNGYAWQTSGGRGTNDRAFICTIDTSVSRYDVSAATLSALQDMVSNDGLFNLMICSNDGSSQLLENSGAAHGIKIYADLDVPPN